MTIAKNLLDSLGQVQLIELMKGFIEKTDEIVDALTAMNVETDIEAIYERAHELKGMAANFGLKKLSEISAIIEKSAKNNQPDIISEEINKLDEAGAHAKKAIQDWLGLEN